MKLHLIAAAVLLLPAAVWAGSAEQRACFAKCASDFAELEFNCELNFSIDLRECEDAQRICEDGCLWGPNISLLCGALCSREAVACSNNAQHNHLTCLRAAQWGRIKCEARCSYLFDPLPTPGPLAD